MLKRLYILAFVVTLLWAFRVYWKVSAARVPASPPAAPGPEPKRATASESSRPAPIARTASLNKQIISKVDTSPEVLLERKRHGAFVVRGHEDPSASPLARYSSLKQTSKQSVGQRKFLILGARAVRPENYHSDMGPVVFEENDLRIVAHGGPGWDQLTTSLESQPLMVNPSNGRLAIVTGALQITTVDVAVAEKIATTENLTLLQYDRKIGVAFLKAPADYALLPALARIGAQPGVSSVELEIVESRKVAR